MNGLNRGCGKKHGSHPHQMAQPMGGMPWGASQSMGGMPWGVNQPMGGMPWGVNQPMGGMPIPNGHVTQVVEPTVHCPPNEFHHHHRVEHIVPVAIKNIHHCHTHHDYVVCKEPEKNEVCHYEHGLECGKDFCNLAQNASPWY